MGKKGTEWRMPVCSQKTRIIHIGIRGWYQNGQNGWNEAEHGSHVEEIDETCGPWRTNVVS